jgi:ribonuclease HI
MNAVPKYFSKPAPKPAVHASQKSAQKSSQIDRSCIQPRELPSGPMVFLYCDGACETAKRLGGWAYVMQYGEHLLRNSGNARETTNNRMELTALLEGLRNLKRPCGVRIVTDSQYLRKAFVERWVLNWQANGWRTSDKKPVKNQDLWESLIEQAKIHALEFVWVKGHSGHGFNDEVDEMAVLERKKLQ